jgi:hypothetical protein
MYKIMNYSNKKDQNVKKILLWNEIPAFGREALITTIADERDLISLLKLENIEGMDRLNYVPDKQNKYILQSIGL